MSLYSQKEKFIKSILAFVILTILFVSRKEEMVSCRAPACANRADKYSN